jgi:hypothetical protein
MGEVYRARDMRLGRIVAVKVCAEQFSERFEREARAVAALNHPHICTLYDVGSNYLVMEYIDGTPVRGPLPVDQALKLAAQIADALDAAHRKGIIHRDLKPTNILLTKADVKLLDFGLAKHDSAFKAAAADETVTRALTREGTIAGTLQYMAPEQLQGKDADFRSDIFSFGCVFYELLAGHRAFDATNPASVIASILKEEPPPINLARPTLPAVDRLVRKCLAKDPDDRWQSARDLRDELRWIESGCADTAPLAVLTPRGNLERLSWIGVLAVVTAVAVFALLRSHPPLPPDRVFRFPLVAPGGVQRFAISPDGEKVVMKGEDGRATLYNFASAELRPLAGLENVDRFLFWFPDSRAIGFNNENQLRKMDLTTGLVSTIVEGAAPSPLAFGSDSVLYGRVGEGVHWLRFPAGEDKVLTKLLPGEMVHMAANALPDGWHFLFFALQLGSARGEMRVGSIDGKNPIPLITTDNRATYAAPGYLLYLKGDTLVAQPFDASRAVITGPPQPLLDRVARQATFPEVSVSQTGVLIYRQGTREQSRLTWFDRSGKQLGTVGELANYTNPALSPDGERLAVDIRDPQTNTRDIWILDLVRGGSTRFTFDPEEDVNAVWSPEGTRIAFSSRRSGKRDIYVKNASGTGQEELLLASGEEKSVEDWSPDGSQLAFGTATGKGWLLSLSSPDRKARIFLDSPSLQEQYSFSPDGKFLAYSSIESGRWEIWIKSLASVGGRWQISTKGGEEPHWRGDGKELFYISRDKLVAVDISVNGNALSAGVTHPLFTVPRPGRRRNRYIVTRDGRRFLVTIPERGGPPLPPTVVVNWPALLVKR